MGNEKTTNELSIYDLYPERYVTVVRGPSGDQSYRGQRLKVLGKDQESNYVILKQIEPGHKTGPLNFWLYNWGFADASILDKPKTTWITIGEVERKGKERNHCLPPLKCR